MKIDSGPIYLQEKLDFDGTELVEELRHKVAAATIRLCDQFVDLYPKVIGYSRKQEGDATFYKRRKPEDSRIDPDKTIREQFNLLRTVDNEKYPAFFEIGGKRFLIKIYNG